METANSRVQSRGNHGYPDFVLQHCVGIVEHRVHRVDGTLILPIDRRPARADAMPFIRYGLMSGALPADRMPFPRAEVPGPDLALYAVDLFRECGWHCE